MEPRLLVHNNEKECVEQMKIKMMGARAALWCWSSRRWLNLGHSKPNTRARVTILLVQYYTGSRVARCHKVLGYCNAGLYGIELSGRDVAMEV